MHNLEQHTLTEKKIKLKRKQKAEFTGHYTQ